MERILVNIPRSWCVVYLDDLLMYGVVFSGDPRGEFAAESLKVPSVSEAAFIGHVISIKGIALNQSKVAMVRDWPMPVNLQQLLRFLGFCHHH